MEKLMRSWSNVLNNDPHHFAFLYNEHENDDNDDDDDDDDADVEDVLQEPVWPTYFHFSIFRF